MTLVLSNNIRHGGHPVLRWMADCLEVKQDGAGNLKPSKPDRRNSGKRIDGMVTLIMGVDRMNRAVQSAYSTPGFILIQMLLCRSGPVV